VLRPLTLNKTMWQPISTAPYDHDLELAVIDRDGEHVLVFPCRRKGADSWIDALTGRIIEVQPTHWREWSEKSETRHLH
jgi:hypothetical protein